MANNSNSGGCGCWAILLAIFLVKTILALFGSAALWILGILGALFFLGRSSIRDEEAGQSNEQREHVYLFALMQLCACVMKADGSAQRSELNVIKDYLAKTTSTELANEALAFLREQLAKPQQNPAEIARSIGRSLNRQSRVRIVYILLSIAAADHEISASEEQVLQNIAINLHLTAMEYNSLRAMFPGGAYNGRSTGGGHSPRQDSVSLDKAYQILQVSPDASDAEVKKAHRKMALQHHPDRYATHGEAAKREATEKFQKIQEAYELIKKYLGFS